MARIILDERLHREALNHGELDLRLYINSRLVKPDPESGGSMNETEKEKARGGYGVRSEAGEGDRVRCFCWQSWVREGGRRGRRERGSMSSLWAEHELLSRARR